MLRKYVIPRLSKPFELVSSYKPAGDQPGAINELVNGINEHKKDQVLLGVTGSGKTFTMAQIIQRVQRPAIIMAHNKTLAAQLYSEMKSFFPNNAVEYFISFYDYYQPEAYVPSKDLFIEKDSQINEQIEMMRHSATRSFLERTDTIVVASVSCIYGIGSPETYGGMVLELRAGMSINRHDIFKHFVELQYTRNDVAFERNTFRARGDTVDIYPSHMEDRAIRLSFFDDELESITEFDSLTGQTFAKLEIFRLYPASHYAVPRPTVLQAVAPIKKELQERLLEFKSQNKLLESQRLEERTNLDLEYIETTGFCKGIENYSRHLTGRAKGEPPPTLFEYLPENAILFVDESHVTIPQINGMYKGDQARKSNLANYGFRLPSCLDNRPLKFDEWEIARPQTIFVSATPANYELEKTSGVFTEQVIRPTGLLDPICIIKPVKTQVDDVLAEIRALPLDERMLITTLTKKMAEYLTDYLSEQGVLVRYMHSDIDTIERITIVRDLRLGKFQVLVGINLLREGLDMPECSTVAILDADKEGFLRSRTSLIQTIGRAARHPKGRAILYADNITNSMKVALEETERRRKKQQEYNKANNIIPTQTKSAISDVIDMRKEAPKTSKALDDLVDEKQIQKQIKIIKRDMKKSADNLEFEKAIELRAELHALEQKLIAFSGGNVDD